MPSSFRSGGAIWSEFLDRDRDGRASNARPTASEMRRPPRTSLEIVSDEPNGTSTDCRAAISRPRPTGRRARRSRGWRTACRPCSRNRSRPGSSGKPSCAPLVSDDVDACFGEPDRQREMQEGMVGARTAEGAGKHQRGRAALRALRRRPARRRSCPCPAGTVLRRNGREVRPAGRSGTESKSPTQSSGMTPSAAACRMPASAAMTRAPATCASRRGVRTKLAAEED